MRHKVTLNLDSEFVRQVDVARGQIPRSRWLEGVVVEHGYLPYVPTVEEQAQMDREDVSRNPPVSDEVKRGTPYRAPESQPVDTDSLREQMAAIESRPPMFSEEPESPDPDEWPPPEPSL